MNKRKLTKILLLIIWMIIIFLFSNQPNSGNMTHNIIRQIFPFLKESIILDYINFIIRKCAHISEYIILTYLIYSLLKEYSIKRKYILIISILFCALYACTDEYHQSFVKGRSATIKDCIIDTSGGILFLVLNSIYQKKKN